MPFWGILTPWAFAPRGPTCSRWRRTIPTPCWRFGWAFGGAAENSCSTAVWLDHTVANFQTLQFLADHGAVGYLIGNTAMVTVVKNGKITFPAGLSGTVSVFCMGPDAVGVTEKGLFYGLENAALTSGFPLGVSNHFTGEEAEISVKNGSLLVLWERKCGFPER